jgi:hypothetical protein
MPAADTLARIESVNRKADAILNVQHEVARRDLARMRRADALEEQERRDKARRWADACQKHQARYQPAYDTWTQMVPQPAADEAPGDYRRRLFRGLMDKLPLGHELEGLDPNDLDTHAIGVFEPQLIEAAGREGLEPTGDNVPETLDDPRAKRERVDSLGTKFIEWRAKRSFIHDFSRPALRVLRINDPQTGRVLYGPAYPTKPA